MSSALAQTCAVPGASAAAACARATRGAQPVLWWRVPRAPCGRAHPRGACAHTRPVRGAPAQSCSRTCAS